MNSPVDELKPCPFCGGYPKFPEAKDVFGTCYEAGCHHCGLAWLDMQIIDCFDYPRDKVHASYNEETHQYGLEYIEEVRRQAIGRWNTRAECPDSVEEAGQSRSTPPPVAGGEPVKKCAFPNCACDMRVICQMAYSALQHQDCVVISRECAESALNDVIYNIAEYRLRKSEGNWGEAAEKALENYCKYEAELKQSLERKNGQ